MTSLSIQDLRRGSTRLDRRLDDGVTVAAADLVPLVRAELVRHGYATFDPKGSPLDGFHLDAWAQCGLVPEGGGWRAEPWLPTWLDHHGQPPDSPGAQRLVRQHGWQVMSDPFAAVASGHSNYRTAGQRVAVRTAVVAQPGDTVLCVLPTGSGKTDVVFARARLRRPAQTLVLVPTVSLALDLERRAQADFSDPMPFAYHGHLGPEEKERFRRRVAQGDQWLTITSPEAACTVLAGPLEQSARHGRLDSIGIDEAHIVAEWGDDFRPAFHAFAGLRRRLIDIAPPDRRPITLLLTGTLDSYGYATLVRLFPGERQVFLTAQATRPEPAYWSGRCANEAQKRERFLEAVRHLPRPLLVYTTLHTSPQSTNTSTVRAWLQAAGYRAVATVDGRSSAAQRAAAVSGLQAAGAPKGDLDIVIATSAFGLGVDISDIRAVVHLCLPESVDRLYQEVGRAGRDGAATCSLALWTSEDEDVANDLTRARLIGSNLAWRRWKRMRLGHWNGDRLTVDLTASHDTVRYPSSEANRYWNSHTLAAMDRAGMVRLEWPEPPDVPSDADDDELRDIFERHRSSASVHVIASDLGDESAFRSRFAAGQQTAKAASSASLSSAAELLSGVNECTNRYLARHYRVSDAEGNLFSVERQCGGCPDCRSVGRPITALRVAPDPVTSGHVVVAPGPLLRNLAADGRLCLYTDSYSAEDERTLVERLVRHGVVALVAGTSSMSLPALDPMRFVWWFERVSDWIDRGNGPCRVPTLLRVDASMDDVTLSRALALLAHQPLGIILVGAARSDPANPKQALREGWSPSFRIDDVLRRL